MNEAKEMAGDVLSTAHDSNGDREGSSNRLPASAGSAPRADPSLIGCDPGDPEGSVFGIRFIPLVEEGQGWPKILRLPMRRIYIGKDRQTRERILEAVREVLRDKSMEWREYYDPRTDEYCWSVEPNID